MSSCAPSSVLAEASWKASPDSGCRCGSVATLEQTSVSREAVMSLTSLWRMVGNPSMWQTMAWSEVNVLPQVHCRGVFWRAHPYRRQRESLNSPLFKWKPWFRRGSTDSHEEAPRSLARSTHRFCCGESWP